MQIEAYGTEAQQALLRRGRALFDLLRNDPRYDYYGRVVGVVSRNDTPVETMLRLAQVQGASHFHTVPEAETADLRAAVEGAGFAASIYRHWTGAAEALDAARKTVDTVALPAGVTLDWITPDTPADDMQALSDAAGSVGVLTLAGDVLRGIGNPAAVCFARDATGRIVSCAASSRIVHPDHPERGGEVWWGMLATRVEARGAKLSLCLGAHAMLAMHERYGATRFFTGVQDGNAASEAVCTRMGLAAAPFNVVTVIDTASLPGRKLTS